MMTMTSVAPKELATSTPAGSWILRRETADEWCSIACSASGWALRMYAGEFTVQVEVGPRPDGRELDALRAHLRSSGWRETPDVALHPKTDRRRTARGGLPHAQRPPAPATEGPSGNK
jgi:hypothetical protein